MVKAARTPAFHISSWSDASRLVDGVVLQRSGRVALRASGVLRKKSYSDSCAKVRKSAHKRTYAALEETAATRERSRANARSQWAGTHH